MKTIFKGTRTSPHAQFHPALLNTLMEHPRDLRSPRSSKVRSLAVVLFCRYGVFPQCMLHLLLVAFEMHQNFRMLAPMCGSDRQGSCTSISLFAIVGCECGKWSETLQGE
jgi:hypothetical protein